MFVLIYFKRKQRHPYEKFVQGVDAVVELVYKMLADV